MLPCLMQKSLRERLYQIIFNADTVAGRRFDVVLLWLILISVLVVLIESIPRLNKEYGDVFFGMELFLTGLFTAEYMVRIAVSPRPLRYVYSYWGIIDLLGVLPFYIGLTSAGYHYFVVFRLLRLLRVFRILRLLRFIHEGNQLYSALRASVYKIVVFISFVLTLIVLLGTIMYVVEGPGNGFSSIPQSIYWTIVTLTTVGYGDITPQTGLGKWVASIIMLCGYAIIAVPTGIVTVEMSRAGLRDGRICGNCKHHNPAGSNFCNQCGQYLPAEEVVKR